MTFVPPVAAVYHPSKSYPALVTCELVNNVIELPQFTICVASEAFVTTPPFGLNVIEYCINSCRASNIDQLKLYDKHWFDEVVMLPFENIFLPCPAGYDSILRTKYGDYMVPVKEGTMHGTVLFDLNQSYKQIVENKIKELPWYRRFWHTH